MCFLFPRTNRGWNSLIKTDSVWTQIDLVPFKINMEKSWPNMRLYFTASLRSLHLGQRHYNNHSTLTDHIMKDISNCCKNLRELSFMGLNLLKLKSSTIPKSVVTLQFTKCRISHHWFRPAAEVMNLHNLTTLKMKYNLDSSVCGLHFLLEAQAIPNLENLSVINNPQARYTNYSITGNLIRDLVDNCPKLNTLNVINGWSDEASYQLMRNKGSLKNVSMNKS